MPQYKLTTSWPVDIGIAIEAISGHDRLRLASQFQSAFSSAIRQAVGSLPIQAEPIRMDRWQPSYAPPPAKPKRQELEAHLL